MRIWFVYVDMWPAAWERGCEKVFNRKWHPEEVKSGPNKPNVNSASAPLSPPPRTQCPTTDKIKDGDLSIACVASVPVRFKRKENLTNWRQFLMRLSCYWSWISSSHCQSRCGSTRRQPSGSADYFDNVMTIFIVNNRTDSLKTDINLFFTIINCRIELARSLTRRMNFKFMCLSAYWP